MQAKIGRILLIIGGYGLIALGVVGLFVPVLQGILFIVAGVMLLAGEYAWARWLRWRIRQRFPVACRRASEWALRIRQSAARLAHAAKSWLLHPSRAPGSSN